MKFTFRSDLKGSLITMKIGKSGGFSPASTTPMLAHDTAKIKVFELFREPRSNWQFRMVPSERFVPLYDQQMRVDICEMYAEYAGGVLYDGPTVNLEGISDPDENGDRVVFLSLGGFYDFLACNIIGRESADNDKKIQRYFSVAGASREMLDMVDALGKRYSRERERIKNFESCIRGSKLPNTIAVSALVIDDEGNALLSRRTDNVIIAKKLYGTSATGSVELSDVAAMGKRGKLFTPDSSTTGGLDPFCAAAQRELIEETTLQIPSQCFSLRGLVIGRAKLQPIAIVDVRYPGVFSDGFRIFDPRSDDPDAEVEKIVAIPRDRLEEMTHKYAMTEAADYHIRLHC